MYGLSCSRDGSRVVSGGILDLLITKCNSDIFDAWATLINIYWIIIFRDHKGSLKIEAGYLGTWTSLGALSHLLSCALTSNCFYLLYHNHKPSS